MKTKISRKQIRTKLEAAIGDVLTSLELKSPSKKTRKVVDKISKRLTNELKRDLKKQLKLSMVKASGANGKRSVAAESKSQIAKAS